MCGKNCGKDCGKDCGCSKNKCNNEYDFHRLTRKITDLEIERAKLALKNKIKCNPKMCSICKCPNGKYEYLTDSRELTNLCKYCIKKITHTKNPIKSINEYECPVCGETDGRNVIRGITTSLCDDCYNGINDKF